MRNDDDTRCAGNQLMNTCPLSFIHCCFGAADRRRARVDPPDQHDAASAGGVGGDGVSAGQPEEAPHLDPPQATAVAAAADGGRRGHRAAGRPAAAATSWGNLLGGTKTHHVVLLDDSFSMSDRWDDTDAFAEAQANGRTHRGRGRPASATAGVHAVAFFARAAGPCSARTIWSRQVGNDFADKLGETLKKLDVSQTAAGPADALRAVNQLLGEPRRRAAHLVHRIRFPRERLGRSGRSEKAPARVANKRKMKKSIW